MGESVNGGEGTPSTGPKPLRILFLNRFFYPDQSATSQMLTDLAEGLALRGHAVMVVAGALTHRDAPERLPAFERRGGIEIRRARTTRFGRGGVLARLADYTSFFPSAFLVSLRVPNVDVVVALSDPPLVSVLGALAAKVKRARFVHWAHDIYPEVAVAAGVLERNSPWARALDRVSRWALSRADMVVALGEDMARRLAEKGVDRDKINVIPNWADGEAIRPCPVEENSFRRGQGWNGKFVVMYSGNIGVAHDFRPLLDAAKRLSGEGSILFAFVGGGSRLPEVRAYVSENGLPNVVFLPHQDRGLLSQILTAADLHVVSLAREMKGLVVPSKLYGAMAAGRPVLFVGPLDSDIAGTIEEGGFGAVAGDGAAAETAIRRLASDPDLRRSMGGKARQVFDAWFSRNDQVRRFAEAIHPSRSDPDQIAEG